MALEGDIARAFDELWLQASERNWVPGRLGHDNGSGYDVTVPDRTGYVYVSLGVNGERGRTVALDKVGVDTTATWQEIRMRREKGELVIREATTLSGGGGGGGVTDLDDLSDVAITSLADGHILQYSSSAGDWVNVVPSGGSGGAPSPHALSGEHHSGQLDWDDIDTSGSNLTDIATRAHAALQGITANDHHDQVHDIVGSDHTIDASAFQVVGATATDTLGLLTPSANPGAAAAILRTDSNGSLALDTNLFVVNGSTNAVTIDGTLFAVDADDNTVKIGSSLFAADTDTGIVAIDTNLVYADSANNRVGINKTPGNAALDIVASSNADHTQRIKQKSGQTGRMWRVEDVDGNELISLNSVGDLASGMPGFVSGLTGWRITHHGNAEFNNAWIRGELHATVFVKDEIHATGGTMLVASAGKLYSDADIDADEVDTETLQFEQGNGLEDWEIEQGSGTEVLQVQDTFNYIEIEDPPSGPGFYFQPGDIVRSKTEVPTGVTDFWLEILTGVQLDGYARYGVIKRSGTDGTLPAGSAVVSYGVEGDGRILLTSDLQDAPYIDVFTVGPEVWTGEAGSIIPHVRLGRLDGVNVPGVGGVEQYGMIAGTVLSDANSPYIVASDLQLRLHKVDMTLNDGTNDTGEWDSSGNLTIGRNIGQSATTSFRVVTTGTHAGDVVIGNTDAMPPDSGDASYLWWDDSGGILHVKGDLLIEGSSYLTEEDLADTDIIGGIQDDITAVESDIGGINSTLTGIPGQISAAQTAAQAYSQAFRVVGVSGTLTPVNPSTGVPDPNTVWWGNPTNLTVRFGDGRTVTVTDGNTGDMAGRTFLYISASSVTTATMQTTTDIDNITFNDVLIAVADTGTTSASVSVTAGSTFISGDNIVTGSITANNIAANTITGDKIFGTELSAIKTNTGSLSVTGDITVGTSGAIQTSGKDDYADTTAGFFLGYSGGAYKLDIGDNNSYLRWDGDSLTMKINDALDIVVPANDNVFSVNDGVFSAVIDYTSGEFISSANWQIPIVTATKFDNTGDTFRIRQARTISTSSNGGEGLKGEISWDNSWLFICTQHDPIVVWKKIPLSSI